MTTTISAAEELAGVVSRLTPESMAVYALSVADAFRLQFHEAWSKFVSRLLSAFERAGADGDRIFSADHPRGAVAVSRPGGLARRDRGAAPAKGSSPPGRAARPPAPLRLCHDAGVPSALWLRSLSELPDIETLEDAGLVGRPGEALPGGDAVASELRGVLGYRATKRRGICGVTTADQRTRQFSGFGRTNRSESPSDMST